MNNKYANDLYPTVWGHVKAGGKDYLVSTVLRGHNSETVLFRRGRPVNLAGIANVSPQAALMYHEYVDGLVEVTKGRLKIGEVASMAYRFLESFLEKDERPGTMGAIGRNLGLSEGEVGSLELALR